MSNTGSWMDAEHAATPQNCDCGQLRANLARSVPGALPRELTRAERLAIRALVIGSCANHDGKTDCLPLGSGCYMLTKCWTGSYCKYFREAVLPNDPALEALLTGGATQTRLCAYCGEAFAANGRQAYCSPACAQQAHRGQKRDSIRKKRGRK